MVYKVLSLLFFLFAVESLATQTPEPYILKGKEVEKQYRAYVEKLSHFEKAFKQTLEKEAPDLSFEEIPAQPIKIGYQILPQIILDEFVEVSKPKQYSWIQVGDFINQELENLDANVKHFLSIQKRHPKDRRDQYKDVLEKARILHLNQTIIDQHMQYNWFWQKQATNTHTLQKDYIFPKYLKLKNQSTIEVPVYTDITDKVFIKTFINIVESRWQYEQFKVKVELHTISPINYQQTTQPFDLNKHLEHFNQYSGAILTTGASTTHAIAGRYIALGPQNITQNVLAHEFGHLLGFKDVYKRTYRNLGKDGFEITESIPDRTDIMCAPGVGRVQAQHFEKIFSLLKASTRIKK